MSVTSIMSGSIGDFQIDDMSLHSIPSEVFFSEPSLRDGCEEDQSTGSTSNASHSWSSIDLVETTDKDASGRHWFCTVFPDDGGNTMPPEFLTADAFAKHFSAIQSIALQSEIGSKTGRFHCHVMVKFGNCKSFSAIRSKFHKLKWSGQFSMQDRNKKLMRDRLRGYRYCCKERTRVPGTVPLIWGDWNAKFTLQWVIDHNVPETRATKREAAAASLATSSIKKKSKKVKNEDLVYDLIQSFPRHKLTKIDVLRHIHANCSQEFFRWAGLNARKLQDIVHSESDTRPVADRVNNGVIVRYGAAGTGKTTSILQECRDLAVGTDLEGAPIRYLLHKYVYGEAFQNYCDQPVLWMSEFHGSVPLQTFKGMGERGRKGSDVYHSFPRKNTTPIDLNVSHIYIDCNCNLTSQYPNKFAENHTNWDAFSRRLTKVYYYPHCRLQPGATSLTDFFYDDNGVMVCNKFHPDTNPNPSFVDVTRFLSGQPYHDALAFEAGLDTSHLIGTKRDMRVIPAHFPRVKDYSFAIGVWEWSLTRNCPKWIEELVLKYKKKLDMDTFDVIKTRFMSGIHTPPDVTYDSGVWSVHIN